MHYYKTPPAKKLFFLIVLLLSPLNAIPDELGQQVGRLQSQVSVANDKIAALEIKIHNISSRIKELQNISYPAQQNLQSASSMGASLETTRVPTRTANGHGR